MTVQNPTTNYGWILPTEGGSNDTWGTELNEMMAEAAGAAIESIDTVLAGLQAELDAEQLRITDADERTLQLEGSAPRPAYARVWLGTDLTVTLNTALDVPTWTEDFDKNDMFSTATASRLTIPDTFDGLYTIRGVIRVPMSSGQSDDSPIWYARIIKGGSTVMAEVRTPFLNAGYNDDGTIGDQTLIVECLVDAVGAEYFELEVYYVTPSSGSGAATLQVVAGVQNTYFEAYRHRSPIIGAQAAAAGFIYSTNSSGTAHTISLPAEARTAGQMLVVVFQPRANVTSTIPAGYSEIYDSGAGSSVSETKVWIRRITGAEAGGGTIASTTSLGRESVAVVALVNDPHATSDPEVGGGDHGGGDFDSTLSVTPSWGTDLTLYLVIPSWGGPADDDLDAIPTGWTGTDLLPSDPDENQSSVIAGGIANSLSYKTGAGAATTVPDHTFDPNVSGWGVVIAIRGATLN